MSKQTYHGSCHCGAARYRTRLDLSEPTTRCNCSICTKTRMWFAVAGADDFEMLEGVDSLTEYQWVAPEREGSFLHFQFCEHCGVRLYAWADDPETGRFHAVVLASLDDVDADTLAGAPIKRIDGRHDRFEAAPADVRLL